MLEIVRLDGLVIEEQGDEAPPPADLAATIDEIWRQEQARRPGGLHDGEVFSVSARSGERIGGCFVPYRRWIAQWARPELRARLGVRPLAVSGLLRLGEGSDGAVVFGRRSAGVTQDAGCWELVPSGGIDPSSRLDDGRIDAAAALHAELEEELGVSRDHVLRTALLGLVHDDASAVHDVVYELVVGMDAARLQACFAERGSGEYEGLRVVLVAGLQDFLRDVAQTVAPVSREVLRLARLIT